MRHFITLACLLGAVTSYYFGLEAGVTGLCLVGGVLELLFWARVFKRPRSRTAGSSTEAAT